MSGKFKHIVLLCLSFCSFFVSHTQDWTWAKSQKGNSNQRTYGVTADSNSNVYISGYFQDSINLLGAYLSSIEGKDGFLASYDSSGAIQWQKQLECNGDLEILFLETNDSLLLFSGEFKDTLFYNDSILISSGNKDLFYGVSDMNGNIHWIKKLDGFGSEEVKDMTFSEGKWLICGLSTSTNLIFNNEENHINNGSSDAINFEIDLEGNVLWQKCFGGTFEDESSGIDINSDNEIIIQISYSLDANFEANQHSSLAEHDIVLLKYIPNNDSVLWSVSYGSYQDDHGGGITIDENGNIYSTGDFNMDLIANGNDIASNGSYDIFITKHDKNGELVWMTSGGGTGSDHGYDIVYKDHLIFTTGTFGVLADFNQISFATGALSNSFVCIQDTNGNFINVIASEGNSSTLSEAYQFHITSFGYGFLAGTYRGYPNMGNLLSPQDSDEGFVSLFSYDQLITSNKSSIFNDLNIYPNPCSNRLIINHEKKLSQSYIFNSEGKLIKSLKNNGKNIDINLSNGLYVIVVYDENMTKYCRTFIVEN